MYSLINLLNRIFFPANEKATLKQNSRSDFRFPANEKATLKQNSQSNFKACSWKASMITKDTMPSWKQGGWGGGVKGEVSLSPSYHLKLG